MKLMRIHYCQACKWNKVFIEKVIRFKCTNPEAKTKKGHPRILNKRLICKGQFPEFCPLEDADFGAKKEYGKGYNHEKVL